MLDIDKESLQGALKELKQSIYNHELWHKDLTRTIIGRLPCDQRDVDRKAHRNCCFGLWLYQRAPASLLGNPAFTPVRVAHKQTHRLAAKLLTKLTMESTISLEDYDEFNVGLDQFRIEVKTLEREIEGILYNHDPLTGAETLVAMNKELSKLAEQVRQHIQTCSVAMMNIDFLKQINETYGHETGDRALSVAVRYVIEQLRPYDRVYRYNRGRFLITMPGTDIQSSFQVIERIRNRLGNIAVAYDGPKPIFITASFGLAFMEVDINPAVTAQRADQALFAAKTVGRNSTHIWDPSIISS